MKASRKLKLKIEDFLKFFRIVKSPVLWMHEIDEAASQPHVTWESEAVRN